jgi:colanic acid biosynthesis glycosyl transferase WcaI
MPKKITIITAFFYPEDTAIGLYTTQFSKFLSEIGYEVKIITGFPNYPQWKIREEYSNLPSFYIENMDDIEIIRYKQYVPEKVTFKGRILMMLSLFYGTLRNLNKIKETDLVICIVPFTISILPALLLSKLKKAKLWVHVQDFEFDLALDSGIINNKSYLSKIVNSIIILFERKMLNASNIVSSISFSMLSKIKEKSCHKEPYYFPNWVSFSKINPEISSKHPLINSRKFTLLYSGNIGEKQDWAFLEKLCEIINPDENIEIVIVGDGGFKDTLKLRLESYIFVKFFDPVPYEELNDLLCSADVHFLFQKTDVINTIMPSKILGMMASNKPSIISGNKDSEVLTIVNQSKGGFYFSENNILLVYETIILLKNDPIISKSTGDNARSYIISKFAENKILDDFQNKIKAVLS